MWDRIKAPFAAISAIIAVVAAIIGLQTDWYGLQEKSRCTINGTTFNRFSGQPAGGVEIGYAPYNLQVQDERALDFRTITTSRTDGTFEGTCEGAHEDGGDESIEILVKGRFGGDALPCLTPQRTGIGFNRKGKQEDISLSLPEC